MARETFTKLIDDLDGGEAHETVKFGLDGHQYEIDLSTKNAKKLRSELATFVEHGNRVSTRAGLPGIPRDLRPEARLGQPWRPGFNAPTLFNYFASRKPTV